MAPIKCLAVWVFACLFKHVVPRSTSKESSFVIKKIKDNVLHGAGVALVITGSQSGERVTAMQARFKKLGSTNNAPALKFINGVSGTNLKVVDHISNESKQEIIFHDHDLNLKVLLWDWREGGLGGAGMNAPTVARITACALSHIYAAREAMLIGKWPALILEDDVVFDSLLDQQSDGKSVIKSIIDEMALRNEKWGIIQLGYLLPSTYAAVEGLLNHMSTKRQSRLRDACSSDHKMVGIQGYLLSELGAKAILDKYWPGGSKVSTDKADSDTAISSKQEVFIDLRPSVNFAADYLIFNAMGYELPTYISWRPWLLEDGVTSAQSSLFPGTVKQASHDTAALTQLFLNDSPLLDNRHIDVSDALLQLSQSEEYVSLPEQDSIEGLSSLPIKRSKIADWLMWGDQLIRISSIVTIEGLKQRLGLCSGNDCLSQRITVVDAVLSQCFDVCSPLGSENNPVYSKRNIFDGKEMRGEDKVTILFPGAMQCWRVSLKLGEIMKELRYGNEHNQDFLHSHHHLKLLSKCAEWGLEKDVGTCSTLIQAFALVASTTKNEQEGADDVLSFIPEPFLVSPFHPYEKVFDSLNNPFSTIQLPSNEVLNSGILEKSEVKDSNSKNTIQNEKGRTFDEKDMLSQELSDAYKAVLDQLADTYEILGNELTASVIRHTAQLKYTTNPSFETRNSGSFGSCPGERKAETEECGSAITNKEDDYQKSKSTSITGLIPENGWRAKHLHLTSNLDPV